MTSGKTRWNHFTVGVGSASWSCGNFVSHVLSQCCNSSKEGFFFWRLMTSGSYSWSSGFLSCCSFWSTEQAASSGSTQCSWCRSGSTNCARQCGYTSYGSCHRSASCSRGWSSCNLYFQRSQASASNYGGQCFVSGDTHGRHESSDCSARTNSVGCCLSTVSANFVSWCESVVCKASNSASCSSYSFRVRACSRHRSTGLCQTNGSLCHRCSTSSCRAVSSHGHRRLTSFAKTTGVCDETGTFDWGYGVVHRNGNFAWSYSQHRGNVGTTKSHRGTRSHCVTSSQGGCQRRRGTNYCAPYCKDFGQAAQANDRNQTGGKAHVR